MKSSSRASVADEPISAGSPIGAAGPIGARDEAAADEPDEADWNTPFEPEEGPTPPPKRPSPVRRIPIAVPLGVCACIAAGWFLWQTYTAAPAASAPAQAVVATGTAEFDSVPPGSSVEIDGTKRGVTPLRLSLPAGAHRVTISNGVASRTLPLTVTPGGVVSQYIELAAPQAAAGGRLEISSDPPGARVDMDGAAKGRTPLVLSDVAPGQYRITVSAGGNAVNRTVNVTRGMTSTLLFSIPSVAPNAAAGWLTIDSPVDMEILEDGRVLGNTKMDRLMLPVGTHRLQLANAGLEFTAVRTVEIAAGRTAKIAVALPRGQLSVNAVPWADVSLDGAPLGTTPLGSLSVPIGTHELSFRHPQFGERRQTVTVKAQTAARIGIDLRK